MKLPLRGRSLGVDLSGEHDKVAGQLRKLGLVEAQANELAQAACRYADEETQILNDELTPSALWPGMVVCRRHLVGGRRTAYLILERARDTWSLQAALFD